MDTQYIEQFGTYGVEQTTIILKQLLKERKIPVFAEFNHDDNAKNVGLSMPQTRVLVFGNPTTGTQLMLEHPEIAYELPLRILISADEQRGTRIRCESPSHMASRYHVEHHPIIEGMQALLQELVENTSKGKLLPYEGMEIFFLVNGQTMEGKTVQINQKESGGTFHIEGYGSCAGPYEISFDQLHRTIFLSREEAEKYKDNEALYLE